jgi:adenylosuccinate synthase
VPPGSIGHVIGVAKLYMSRVGTGPFPMEFYGDIADALRSRAGEYGTSTGRPRRLGWLDLAALHNVARINGVSSLCLTGLCRKLRRSRDSRPSAKSP